MFHALSTSRIYTACCSCVSHVPLGWQEAGRWALGKELPLPQQASSPHWQAKDCWALGEDNSWYGSRQQAGAHWPAAEAAEVLQRAFADGDTFLCLNVPPTWQSGSVPAFASTRPGVLWHCYQVEQGSRGGQHEPGRRGDAAAAPGNSSGSSSWQVQEQDVFGRSLPSSSFSSSQSVASGAFVAQDNTDKVIAASTTGAQQQQPQQLLVSSPITYVVRRGTLLNDHATAGDVDAVFSGKAAVSTLQTWPAGHPLALRDEVLVAALNEDATTGLPAWLNK